MVCIDVVESAVNVWLMLRSRDGHGHPVTYLSWKHR